jgi:bacterioferritin (cytochrome b1)
MNDSASQSTVSDILNDLLDLESSSVFQFLGDSALYVNRSTAAFRRPLAEMIAASHRRASELSNLIENLGGTPIPRGLQAEDQYLAYLSLKFLLPRMIGAKKLAIVRWETARNLLADRSPQAAALLDKHLAEHRAHLSLLQRAAGER